MMMAMEVDGPLPQTSTLTVPVVGDVPNQMVTARSVTPVSVESSLHHGTASERLEVDETTSHQPAFRIKYSVRGHKRAVAALRFSPCGAYLASACRFPVNLLTLIDCSRRHHHWPLGQLFRKVFAITRRPHRGTE